MLFMVVEKFRQGKKPLVYERYKQKGRMLPEGLVYVDSWIESDGDRCFQLMQTNQVELFDEWISNWHDLVEFEIIPVEVSPTSKKS
ncbi:hypothetical protein YTPLAS21_21360 [Candidatus Nitrosocosmicus sp.]|nr:hypothetical protein YTPLAS21_21360 [Candidatus Nitrosocosmicus sp.]